MDMYTSRVPSWTWGSYPRFGAWTHVGGLHRGFTLRYRDRLLVVTLASTSGQEPS